jgi:hypothetical protein
VNNKDRNFTHASLGKFIKTVDAALDDYLQRLDHGERAESGTAGSRVDNLAEKIAALPKRRDRYTRMLSELHRTGEDQISLTDPDSREMAAHTRVAVGYNAQIAVDAKHLLIVNSRLPTRWWTWVCRPSLLRRRSRVSVLSRSRRWPTRVISRSGTSKPARMPGLMPMCRARSEARGQSWAVPQG